MHVYMLIVIDQPHSQESISSNVINMSFPPDPTCESGFGRWLSCRPLCSPWPEFDYRDQSRYVKGFIIFLGAVGDGLGPAGDAAEVRNEFQIKTGLAGTLVKVDGGEFRGILHIEAFLGTSDSFPNSFSSS